MVERIMCQNVMRTRGPERKGLAVLQLQERGRRGRSTVLPPKVIIKRTWREGWKDRERVMEIQVERDRETQRVS